jgi:hypothetical protein
MSGRKVGDERREVKVELPKVELPKVDIHTTRVEVVYT